MTSTIRIDVRITTRALLKHIADAPGAHTYNSLAADLCCGRMTIARHMARLYSLGFIEITRDWQSALYRPTAKGLEALNVRNEQAQLA